VRGRKCGFHANTGSFYIKDPSAHRFGIRGTAWHPSPWTLQDNGDKMPKNIKSDSS
jgi:hypothetical protein